MQEELRYELQKRSTKREIYDWMESIVFALVCIILVFTFVGRIVRVDGKSMEPTLADLDRLISSRLFYSPRFGDIIVITQPNDVSQPLVKRIIALEGQTIDIDFDTGDVTVDGAVLNEPYILQKTFTPGSMTFPQTVPEGHVFVMGDNRNNSLDSRSIKVGMVDERYILGRVLFRIYPYESLGHPDSYWEKA